MDLGDTETAERHMQLGFQSRPLTVLPYRGTSEPVLLLVLISAMGGTVPIYPLLDDRIFQTSILATEFLDPAAPLPPHHLIFNAMGDADLARPALEVAATLLTQTQAPVLNRPQAVLATGRADNAAQAGSDSRSDYAENSHFSPMRNWRIPRLRPCWLNMASRFRCCCASLAATPAQLRQGREPRRAASCAGEQLAAPELVAIQFLDAQRRRQDPQIRVMMIHGELYPLHSAVSRDWKIHYFTAEMADHPEHRAEDAAFLADMPRMLGPRAMTALRGFATSWSWTMPA